MRLRIFSGRNLVLSRLPNVDFIASGLDLASIPLSDPSVNVTSSDNLLAYVPNFEDTHNSNLGAIFLNLERIFPCSNNSVSSNSLICSLATREEDGFNKGRALLVAQDFQFGVFGERVLTLGIAVQDCPQLTPSCMPNGYSFAVTCQTPPSCVEMEDDFSSGLGPIM